MFFFLLSVVAVVVSLTPPVDGGKNTVQSIYENCPAPFDEVYCTNGGTCFVVLGEAICKCADRFMGAQCEQKFAAIATALVLTIPTETKPVTEDQDTDVWRYVSILVVVIVSCCLIWYSWYFRAPPNEGLRVVMHLK